MKTLRLLWCCLLPGASLLSAQGEPAGPGPREEPAIVGAAAAARRTAEELEQLTGPIALYPDALLALVLPAAASPADVVLAARFLRESPADRSSIEQRPWDESVKSLAYYPEVLKWMDENLEWTKQLGEAFAIQPAEVMQAIQRLRARARAAGTLVDTAEQQVIADGSTIRIVPAQAEVVYVPYYEPAYVFVDRPVVYGSPFLRFGPGWPVGSWLAFECDWFRSTIWIGNRHRPWSGHDWRRPLVPAPVVVTPYSPPHGVRAWHPPGRPGRPAHRMAPPVAPSSATFVQSPPPAAAPAAPVGPRPRPPTGANAMVPARRAPPTAPIAAQQAAAASAPGRPAGMAPASSASYQLDQAATNATAAAAVPASPPRRPPAVQPAPNPPPTSAQPRHSHRPSSAAPGTPPPANPGWRDGNSRTGGNTSSPPSRGMVAPPAASVSPGAPPASRAAPAAPPASARPAPSAPAPAPKSEGEPDRGNGRRNPNEQQK